MEGQRREGKPQRPPPAGRLHRQVLITEEFTAKTLTEATWGLGRPRHGGPSVRTPDPCGEENGGAESRLGADWGQVALSPKKLLAHSRTQTKAKRLLRAQLRQLCQSKFLSFSPSFARTLNESHPQLIYHSLARSSFRRCRSRSGVT